MFGAPKPSTSGSLFGQNNNNPQPQTTSTFGNVASTGGGLFGNNSQSRPAGTSQPSLFGQNSNQPAQTTGLGSGLSSGFGSGLGSSNTNSNANAGTTSSLFGNKPATTTNTAARSTGFGSSLQQPQPQSQQAPSLFSQQQQQPQQPQQQQQGQQQQQQSQQQPVITPFTRPNDLPEAFQTELENMDSYIRQQAQLSEDLQHAMAEHKKLVTSIPRDVQLLRFKLTSARETLKFDDGQLAKLKQLIDNDYHDAELLADVTNHPRKYDRLLAYFRQIASCETTLNQLTLAMRDVQHAVTAEEFGNRVTYDEPGLRALPNAMREEYMYFMSLSDRVAELHRHIKDDVEGETLEEMQF